MTISVPIPSDRDGLLGRECPACEKQFRLDKGSWPTGSSDDTCCPYCGQWEKPSSYWTKEQLAYARQYARRAFSQRLHRELRKLEVRPDPRSFISIAISVKHTPPSLRPLVEQSFRRELVCPQCSLHYTVFGLAYYCPHCGLRGPFEVLAENVAAMRHQLGLYDNLTAVLQPDQRKLLTEMAEHGMFEQLQHDCLENAVTAFEACWRQATHVACNPSGDPEARDRLSAEIRNAYQSPQRGRQLAQRKLGVDIFATLTPDEVVFFDRMFEARHVVTHNSGIMDQKYVTKCGLPDTALGQRLQVSPDEINGLLALVERIAAEARSMLTLPQRARPVLTEEADKMLDDEVLQRHARKQQVREGILGVFYAAQYTSGAETLLPFEDLAKRADATDDETEKALDYMAKRGWVERQMGRRAEATWEGIWHAEEVGAADPEILQHNQEVRDSILRTCGRLAGYCTATEVSAEDVIGDGGISADDFWGNINWLRDYAGTIAGEGGHRLALTPDGEDALDGLD